MSRDVHLVGVPDVDTLHESISGCISSDPDYLILRQSEPANICGMDSQSNATARSRWCCHGVLEECRSRVGGLAWNGPAA